MVTSWKLAPWCLATTLVVGVTAALLADEPTGAAQNENKLIGTWKMVSGKYGGQEINFPEGTTTLKHVTPVHFMWTSYDKDGVMSRSAGGTYTIKGEAYEEVPQYGMSSDFDIIKGKPQKFTWKIDGNKWLHNGELSNGLTIEEVWERVEAK